MVFYSTFLLCTAAHASAARPATQPQPQHIASHCTHHTHHLVINTSTHHLTHTYQRVVEKQSNHTTTVEFFVAPERVEAVLSALDSHPSVSYLAANAAGETRASKGAADDGAANAITWGVFPGEFCCVLRERSVAVDACRQTNGESYGRISAGFLSFCLDLSPSKKPPPWHPPLAHRIPENPHRHHRHHRHNHQQQHHSLTRTAHCTHKTHTKAARSSSRPSSTPPALPPGRTRRLRCGPASGAPCTRRAAPAAPSSSPSGAPGGSCRRSTTTTPAAEAAAATSSRRCWRRRGGPTGRPPTVPRPDELLHSALPPVPPPPPLVFSPPLSLSSSLPPPSSFSP